MRSVFCYLFVSLLYLTPAWASTSDETPDYKQLVSVYLHNDQLIDDELPLWRSAVNTGYRRLVHWLNLPNPSSTLVPQHQDEPTNWLPPELYQYIASMDPSGRTAAALSRLHSKIFFAVLTLLQELHWQHEVNLVAKIYIHPDYRRPVSTTSVQGTSTYSPTIWTTDSYCIPVALFYFLSQQSGQACYYAQLPSLNVRNMLHRIMFGEGFQAVIGPLGETSICEAMVTLDSRQKGRPEAGLASPGWGLLGGRIALSVHVPTSSFAELKPATLELVEVLSANPTTFRLLTPYLPESPTKLLSLHLKDLKNIDSLALMPAGIGRCTNLQRLFLQIPGVPLGPQIADLTHLKILHGEQIAAENLDTVLEKLPQLEELLLQDLVPQLTCPPTSLRKLSNLEVLDLTHNKIQTLPLDFFQLTKLKKLCLESNHLQVIPEQIRQLQLLEEFNITDNKLTTLPPALFEIVTLGSITATLNPISSLPVMAMHTHTCQRSAVGFPICQLVITHTEIGFLKVYFYRFFWGFSELLSRVTF